MFSRITLSIIVVNYNGQSVMADCLTSIFASVVDFKYEVIVVDNASSDGSCDIIRSWKDPIFRIYNKENKGFSVANNQGLTVAQGDWIFLLNNDTILESDTLQKLFDFSKQQKSPVAVGPRLKNRDGSCQWYGSTLGRIWYMGSWPRAVSFLSGAAFWVARDVLQSIGGLDPYYFFYNEDLDLCFTLKEQGVSLIYFPAATLVHIGGVSTKTRSLPSRMEGMSGGVYFVKKHYPQWIFVAYYWLILLIASFASRWHFNPKMRQFYKQLLIRVTPLLSTE